MKAKGFIKCIFSGHCIIDESESIVNGIMHDKRNFLCKCHRCGLYVIHDGAISGLTSRFMPEREAFSIKRELESTFSTIKKQESRTMTRQEAIELLVNATYSEEWQGNEQLTKAQHMAIEALEQEPSSRQVD